MVCDCTLPSFCLQKFLGSSGNTPIIDPCNDFHLLQLNHLEHLGPMPYDPASNQTLSVSQVTGQIKKSLEEGYASVWIKGEISNLTKHGSGHWYFTLKDSGAQLGAVMFRGQNQRVRFDATHGMEVTAHGRISVYPPQGRYQLIVDQLLPAGQGDLHLAFEALKEKLSAEGLFDPELKQNLPPYPTRIGIVTSPTGAAIQDMLNILKRRFPLTDILLLPVKVQGEGAASEIAQAINKLNDRKGIDVLIVGRGGGSLEDLWAFNEEAVARAISRSSIPVVSAVGHETDTTMSDFVADLRAPTPSAAAELVVPDHLELSDQLEYTASRLQKEILYKVQKYEDRIQAIERSYAMKRPQLIMDELIQHLDVMEDRAIRSSKEKISSLTTAVDTFAHRIEALNPLAILKRGYSVVTNTGGAVIRTATQVKIDEKLNIRLSDGELEADVKHIKTKK